MIKRLISERIKSHEKNTRPNHKENTYIIIQVGKSMVRKIIIQILAFDWRIFKNCLSERVRN